MPRPVRVPALAMLLLLLAPGGAVAYVPSTTNKTLKALRWIASNCVMIRVNSNGSQDVPAGSAVAAAKRALSNWRNPTAGCSYLQFQILADSPTAVRAFNQEGPNENVIVWIEEGWEHDPQAAALTTVTFAEKLGSPGDGQILDADIELNGEGFRFSDSGAPDRTDIENTLTHEVGHLLGLDHPCDDNLKDGKVPKDNLGVPIQACFPLTRLPAAMRETTMFNFADPGETKKRSLEADDINGICSTYPKGKDPGACKVAEYITDDSGCALVGRPRPTPLLALLLLASALLLYVRRR